MPIESQENSQNSVEVKDDGYNYERWEVRLGGLFTQLGIVRALAEGDFSDEEKERIIRANADEWKDIVAKFGENDRVVLQKAIDELGTHTKIAAREICDKLAEAIRFAGKMIRQTAPSVQQRDAIDAERELEGDAAHPTHEWLKGMEGAYLASHLSDITAEIEHNHGEAHMLYYEIGSIQRIGVLIENLREKIDEGRIDIGDRGAEDCADAILAARNMVVRAIIAPLPSKRCPEIDLTKIDIAMLDEVADIGGWLGVVKGWSA